MRYTMKALKTAFLSVAGVAALFLCGCSNGESGGFKDLKTEEAFSFMQKNSVFLLDVRTQEEYAHGHLANSVLVPVSELFARLDKLPAAKDTPIIVYCASGNRSLRAGALLANAGYTNVHNLQGGIKGWQKAGHPVVK